MPLLPMPSAHRDAAPAHAFAVRAFAALALAMAANTQETAAAPAAPAAPPARATGFVARTLVAGERTHRYVLFVPPDLPADAPAPLIVFLNGAGECGTDGWAQVSVGLGPAIMANVRRWPFLVLFPQKPDSASAWEDHDAMVMAMLDAVRAEYRVDGERLFLTGLSQGGHGTWVLGARHKDLWAAIAPVCGYADGAAIAQDLAAMPTWCFHGQDDKAVSVQQSRDITAALRAAGGAPALKVYQGVGHDSWNQAYRDEPLAAWLLLARPQPALAHCLAQPPAMATGRIVLTRGERSHSLYMQGGGLGWSAQEKEGTVSSGLMPAGDGQRQFAAALRQLALHRCLEPLPAAPRDSDVRPWHVKVEVPWTADQAAVDGYVDATAEDGAGVEGLRRAGCERAEQVIARLKR